MTWLRLSSNEWRRRPFRVGVTVAGVAIAVAAFCSLLAFSRGYQSGIRLELDRLGAHVLLVPKGCPYDALAAVIAHKVRRLILLGVTAPRIQEAVLRAAHFLWITYAFGISGFSTAVAPT